MILPAALTLTVPLRDSHCMVKAAAPVVGGPNDTKRTLSAEPLANVTPLGSAR